MELNQNNSRFVLFLKKNVRKYTYISTTIINIEGATEQKKKIKARVFLRYIY